MQNGAENLYNYHVDNTHKDYQVEEYVDCTTLDNLLNEFDFQTLFCKDGCRRT